MVRPLGRIRLLGRIPLLLCATLSAQEKPAQDADLRELMNLLDTPVVAASKETQKASEAPAIVTVVTSADIRRAGYRSVAEALGSVPGLYGIDDHLGVNFGIRGISGGLRAYTRIAKVMVDGQPISFRSDTTNFLGPELLPMEIVERIEVVRGPASALYGANAFLGVINVVTKSGDAAKSAVLARASRYNSHFGHGLEGAFFSKLGKGHLLLAGSALNRTNLSGDELSPTSPYLSRYPDPKTDNDISKPMSFYARWRTDFSPTSGLEITGHFSHLDTVAELLDFGILSHQNRIVQDNSYIKAKYEARWDSFAFNAAAAMSKGKPGSKERLYSGSTTTYPKRDVGYDGLDLTAEVKWSFGKKNILTAGVDWTRDDQHLMTVYTVDSATGQATLTSLDQGDKNFQNTGVYAQLMLYPMEGLGLTGNIRYDKHNIYGNKTNYRAGVVWQVTDTIHAKALYGTSFKAPAALQLYAQPLFGGDVLGNASLKPESANTTEIEVGWRVLNSLALTVDAYMTEVKDKVELIPVGANFTPQNLGTQDAKGLESTVQWVYGPYTAVGSYSWQETDDKGFDALGQPTKAPTAFYPTHLAYIRNIFKTKGFGEFELSGMWANNRRASNSNINASLGRAPYAIRGYKLVHLAYSLQHGGSRLNFRIQNLLDRKYAEPGFAGIDLPGRGREFVLSYAMTF